MTVKFAPAQTVDDLDFYPESDGKPMAESDLHREIMFTIIHLLQRHFAGRRVYVSGNLLLYYVEGDPRKSVAPDCFVVWDVEPRRRRIYKLWEEGKGPRVVFEVSSKSTKREDLGSKMRLYAQLGVEEYYIYDPTSEYLRPPLAGFRLEAGRFAPMQPQNQVVDWGDMAFVPGAGEPPEYVSPLLGLRLALDENGRLQFYDEATGERLLDDEEARERAERLSRYAATRAIQAEERAGTAEVRASTAEVRASTAEVRASTAEERAAQAEAENARLRAELARLRG